MKEMGLVKAGNCPHCSALSVASFWFFQTRDTLLKLHTLCCFDRKFCWYFNSVKKVFEIIVAPLLFPSILGLILPSYR